MKTVNAHAAMKPKGKLHTVGVVPEPMKIPAFDKNQSKEAHWAAQISLTLGSYFCVRHNIYPTVEEFPMDQINEAFDHLKRLRRVLELS